MSGFCVDAMPAENAHRSRGIGTVARELVRAMGQIQSAVPTSSVSYICRNPVAGAENLSWLARSEAVQWSNRSKLHPLAVSVLQALDTAFLLPRELERHQCTVFVATDPSAIALSRRFRTVAMLYDLIPLLFPGDYFAAPKHAPRRMLLNLSIERLRKADRLIAISQATRRDAVELLGISADRIDVAHLAVDRAVFRPLGEEGRRRVADRFDLDGPFFLYVGDIDPRKNVRVLVDAFDQVAVTRAKVKLVLVGVSGAARAAFEAQIPPRLAGSGRLVFTGQVPVDELAALYSSALALTFPSRYEGFGLPVLEAMSCGTPVLTSPVSAMPEVAGDAAIYADPNDVAAIARGMEQLLDDEALRESLIRRGLDRASQFSWTATASSVLASCERALTPTRS